MASSASSASSQQFLSSDAHKKWLTLYPAYIEKGRSQRLGRRLKDKDCVAQPTAYGMYNACKKLSIEAHLELDKRYVSDPFNMGRVKVRLPEMEDKTRSAMKHECLARIAKEFAQLETNLREVPKKLLVTSGIISDTAAAAAIAGTQQGAVPTGAGGRQERRAAMRAAKKEAKKKKKKKR